jgi:hypothetical protein
MAVKADFAHGRPRVNIVEGDVHQLHTWVEYAGALF